MNPTTQTLSAFDWFRLSPQQANALVKARPSIWRPGGYAYTSLPVDKLQVAPAGLGRLTYPRFEEVRSAPPLSAKDVERIIVRSGWFRDDTGLTGMSGASAQAGCGELAIRSAMIAMGLRYAGAQPNTQRYYEAVMPRDSASFQRANGIPFGEGGLSSCGMYVRATLDRMGLKDARFNSPYETRVSHAINDLLNLGDEWGAHVKWTTNAPLPKPGDIIHLGGETDNGFEHVGILTAISSDGHTWYTVDGGQPGVEERIRTFNNGSFSDGRNLNGYIDVSKLPLPCPVSYVFPSVLAFFAGAALSIVGYRYAKGLV